MSESQIREAGAEMAQSWYTLSRADRARRVRGLTPAELEALFVEFDSSDRAEVLDNLEAQAALPLLRLLPPDEAADALQRGSREMRAELLALLDEFYRRELTRLLLYQPDQAGGLMTPRFIRLRPEWSVAEALSHVREQSRQRLETVYYGYVLDPDGHLLGVASLRELLVADRGLTVARLMRTEFLSVADTTMDVEVSHLFAEEDLLAVPVLDSQRRMLGIVTIDDVIDVDQDRVTAAMQKQGGMEVLDAPYLKTGLLAMVRKRAGWLAALFIGEMLTASAMAIYQAEIAKAVVLALFVPLIISSGGNSGSQSSTLIIRALALQEVRLRDWFQVLWRELPTGLLLGTVLAVIGLARILLWQGLFHTYGPNYLLIAATVSVSLVSVVSWGTFMGAMLPLLLRRLGFDPASASAPFVATLVDVSGLVIYFTVAETFLRGAAF